MMKKLFFTVFFTSVIAFSSVANDVQMNQSQNIEKERQETPKQEKIVVAKGGQFTGEAKDNDVYRNGLAAYIQTVNQNITKKEANVIVDSVIKSAEKYDVDEKLVMAIAQTESTYYRDAVSCSNYKGLMQTGDILAKEAGYTPQQLFEPAVSIDVGTSYIDEKLEEFGDTRLALTAYNQGAGTVYSGNYSTEYADLALARMRAMEHFLVENGYINVYN